jgi:trehalose 6-phosphate synthase
MEISRYQNLKQEIEQVVGQVNGRFTQPGWTPVHYMFRSLAAPELVAYYHMADIALVTPFRDGMNLIAKEYCACKVHNNGVLILSEFAGAAAQLHHDALIVNPFDIKGIAEAIHRAFTMDPSEKRQRMRRLRRAIQRNDVHRWLDNFLRAAFARTISDFHRTGDFSPSYYPSGSHSERERSLS